MKPFVTVTEPFEIRFGELLTLAAESGHSPVELEEGLDRAVLALVEGRGRSVFFSKSEYEAVYRMEVYRHPPSEYGIYFYRIDLPGSPPEYVLFWADVWVTGDAGRELYFRNLPRP